MSIAERCRRFVRRRQVDGHAIASPARPRHRAAVLPAAIDVALDERRHVRRGVGILIASAVLLGVMAVCVRVAARELPALQIAWVRFTGAFVLLYGLARGRRLRPRPGNLARVLLRGGLGCGAIVCYFAAIGRIGAGLATLVQCTYPIPTAILAVLLLGEPPSWQLAAAIAANLAGLVLVVGPAVTSASADPTGIAIALAGSLLAGGAVTTARHLRASEDASLITVYFMAVGAIATAPALLGGVPAPSPIGAAALVGVVVTSAAGQWLLHHGLGFTSASLGSLACATSIVTAAGLEALFLGEHLGVTSLGGAALMIAAVGLALGREA
jgi:drug/metabolite transporter (DMT)-like permease